MSTNTTNYNLIKPELSDAADVTQMNPNWDTIDSALKTMSDKLPDGNAQEEMWELVSDLHTIASTTFVKWNGNTVNTPYTAGVSHAVIGTAYIATGGEVKTLYAFTTTGNSPKIFTQTYNVTNGWSEWTLFYDGAQLINATSSDGVNYYGTIEGVAEPYDGLEIMIVPGRVSASNSCTFNNIPIRMTLPFNTNNSGALPTMNNWMAEGTALKLRYHAYMNTWKTDLQRPPASSIYGSVAVECGGTGADNASEARANLGVQSQITSGSDAPSGGVNGDVYIQII